MAERFRFDEKGLDDLLESPTGPVAKDLLRRIVRVDRTAKRLCPVKTGRLRSSLTYALESDAAGLVAIEGTDVEYAPHVFLGTSKAPAQPALQAGLAMEVGR